eukprot:PLAT5122.1.p1 GENE.PLAT5122.1~~PLAT5122.1.p1  ORF type:complete len:224 (+),score=48.16 PLAT5122.1:92-673(+)
MHVAMDGEEESFVGGPICGVVIPGRTVTTELEQVEPNKWVMEVPEPYLVSDLTLFLLPEAGLPIGSGAVLYYSVPPFETWTLMGSVTTDRPSNIIRTGWPTHPEVSFCDVIQLGVSLEGGDFAHEADEAAGSSDLRLEFAKQVAVNLFRYMESYARPTEDGEMLVLPMNVLELWMRRFEDKYALDPNFMMKRD